MQEGNDVKLRSYFFHDGYLLAYPSQFMWYYLIAKVMILFVTATSSSLFRE